MDEKNYRQVILPNGLHAILVEDTMAMRSSPILEEYFDDEDDMSCDDNGTDPSPSDDSDSDYDDDDDIPVGYRKAAAAMVVGCGSFFDPPATQGLAHYLEHMVFMGSKKYPTENAYDDFISKHNGDSNAYTEQEHTVFHFDINQGYCFEKALDMFAQFFISPLMLPDAAERELNNVNSEFNQARFSDSSRLQQLMAYTNKIPLSDHPFSTFSWGNISSLKTKPASENVDVTQSLWDLYNRYYYARNMRLVIIAASPLDKIQEMVSRYFSEVPSDPRLPQLPGQEITHHPDQKSTGRRCMSPWERNSVGSPFSSGSLSAVYRVVPVKDRHRLTLTFPLPSLIDRWQTKPADYISHLIGHESAGSILSHLKRLNWASEINAGVSDDGNENASCYSLFTISISLSESGVNYWVEIISTVFSYVNMLITTATTKNLPPHIFSELSTITNIAYSFQDETEPGEFVENWADELAPCKAVPSEHVLDGNLLVFDFDQDEVIDLLKSFFTPENMRIDLMSSSFGRASDYEDDAIFNEPPTNPASVPHNKHPPSPTPTPLPSPPPPPPPSSFPLQSLAQPIAPPFDLANEAGNVLVEPYFNTRYWVHPLSPEILSEFVENLKTSNPNPLLHPPPENPFIPADFSLKKLPADDAAHPLLNASVKVSTTTCKNKTFYPALVTRFDSNKNALMLSYEDEDDVQFHAVDNGVDFFKKLKEGDGFTLEKGNLKCKLVAVSGSSMKFGDGSDNDAFPPIPPPTEKSRLPQLLISTEGLRLRHLQDRIFKRPVSDIRLKFYISSQYSTSPLHLACMDLLHSLVDDASTETVYAASVCELFYSICANQSGFNLRFHGFSQKLNDLASYVLDVFLSFRGGEKSRSAADARFDVVLQNLRRSYKNDGISVDEHCSDARVASLIKGKVSAEELLDALEGMTEGTFLEVVGEVLAKLSVEVLCMGNLDAKDAREFGEMVQRMLKRSVNKEAETTTTTLEGVEEGKEKGKKKKKKKGKKSPSVKLEERAAEVIVKLKEGENVVINLRSKNPKEVNTSVEEYYQIGVDEVLTKTMVDLLTDMMAEPLFDSVRTKENFGYSVGCQPRWTSGIVGVTFEITTSTKTSSECGGRVVRFLEEEFLELLEGMKEEDFRDHVNSLAKHNLGESESGFCSTIQAPPMYGLFFYNPNSLYFLPVSLQRLGMT